jgi:hypothetical protein
MTVTKTVAPPSQPVAGLPGGRFKDMRNNMLR